MTEYNEQIVQQVWEHGRAVSDRDSDEWRKDQCGAWIRRDAYNQMQSDFGWKIHSILPGNNSLDHLRPFHHQNSMFAPNGQVQCHMTADRTGVNPTAYINDPSNRPV